MKENKGESSMDKIISVSEVLEKVKADVCDRICKYPCSPIPKGKNEDWLIDDPESPCNTICPLLRL